MKTIKDVEIGKVISFCSFEYLLIKKNEDSAEVLRLLDFSKTGLPIDTIVKESDGFNLNRCGSCEWIPKHGFDENSDCYCAAMDDFVPSDGFCHKHRRRIA